MNKRIEYQRIIEEIQKHDTLTIDQKLVKKLLNDELPKSCFDYNYLRRGRNELGRFLIDNKDEYDFEVIRPMIIVRKKIKKMTLVEKGV